MRPSECAGSRRPDKVADPRDRVRYDRPTLFRKPKPLLNLFQNALSNGALLDRQALGQRLEPRIRLANRHLTHPANVQVIDLDDERFFLEPVAVTRLHTGGGSGICPAPPAPNRCLSRGSADPCC